MPEFRMINAGELNLRCAIEGSGPLVVMVHGFPESWYSWRHQMTPIAEAGFTACAIDVRGYGGSDKPERVDAYAISHMVGDIVGVIDAEARILSAAGTTQRETGFSAAQLAGRSLTIFIHPDDRDILRHVQ